jgi:hypothetical protein
MAPCYVCHDFLAFSFIATIEDAQDAASSGCKGCSLVLEAIQTVVPESTLQTSAKFTCGISRNMTMEIKNRERMIFEIYTTGLYLAPFVAHNHQFEVEPGRDQLLKKDRRLSLARSPERATIS